MRVLKVIRIQKARRLKMNNKIKGIELVWLSETDLTNLNAGEGGTNIVDVKKYRKEGIEYPYVSGQAMRYYLRESIRRALLKDSFMCTPNDRGETCGNIMQCWNCDLFGFMTTIKGKGAATRVSPVKVSTAMGLLPIEDNSTIDFLTRKKRVEVGEKATGDIVNVELGTNVYKCGISIDLMRIGFEEEIDQETKMLSFKDLLGNNSERKLRIKSVIEGVKYLTDYSKQARLLTDFTPDLLLASLQNRYSHRLQKAFEINENKNLDIDRFRSIVNDLKSYSQLYIGLIPGLLNNEREFTEAAQELNLEPLQPQQVFEEILKSI
jgi:CRISPR-associated protein Cst2